MKLVRFITIWLASFFVSTAIIASDDSGFMSNLPIVEYKQNPLIAGTLTATFRGMMDSKPYTPPAGANGVNAKFTDSEGYADVASHTYVMDYNYDLLTVMGNKVGECTVRHRTHTQTCGESLELIIK